MLIIGLLFLRSRVRGVSSFRWRSLAFVLLHGFFFRVGFCFAPCIYYTFALIYFFGFILIYDGKILRMRCLHVFFFFASIFVFTCLLGFHLGTFLSYLGFGVEGLDCSLGLLY